MKSFTWIFSRCWGLALLLSGEDMDSNPPWSIWKLLSSFPETIWKEKGGPFWGVSLSVTSRCRIPLPTASPSCKQKNTINQAAHAWKIPSDFKESCGCPFLKLDEHINPFLILIFASFIVFYHCGNRTCLGVQRQIFRIVGKESICPDVCMFLAVFQNQ